MKKTVSILVIICLLASLAIVFTACSTYTSEAGKMDEMVGTYKLSKYECKDENDNAIDMISKEGIEAYLVVGSNGYGYYAYKDSNTEKTFDSIKIEYIKDDEDSSLYKAISYTSGKDLSLKDKRPGAFEEPTLGFNVKEKSFNYYVPETQYSSKYVNINVHTSTVKYEKVSTDTSLTYVNDKWETLVNVPQYELKNLKGIYVYSSGYDAPDYGLYKYCVAEIDAYEMKYTVITDYVDGSNSNISGDLIFNTETADSANNIIGTLELGDHYRPVFNVYGGTIISMLCYQEWSEPDAEGGKVLLYSQTFSRVDTQGMTLSEYADELLRQYNAKQN